MADQDSSSNSFGPFTSALTGPLTPANEQAPVSYAPSKSGAIAMYLGKFLQGAQTATRTAYERSEQTKREHEASVYKFVQQKMQDPTLNDAGKAAIMKTFNDTLAAQANELLKKSNKGQKGKDPHPLLSFTQAVTNSVLGPNQNKKHEDLGSLLVDLNTLSQKPEYQVDPNLGKIGAVTGQAAQISGGAQPAQLPQTPSGPISKPTTPPPGTAPAAGQQGQAWYAGMTQDQARSDPRYFNDFANHIPSGRTEEEFPLGRAIAALPKTGAIKYAAPYTVMEGEGENKHPVMYRRGIASDNSEVIEKLGEGKESATGGANAVKITSNVVTKKDALARSKNGEDFVDASTGKPIDVDKIGDGQQLSIAFRGGKPVYTVFSPKYVVQTVGGLKYATTAAEIGDLVKGGGTLLGIAQPDTETTHQEDVVLDGKLTTQNLASKTTRNRVGVLGEAKPATNAYGSPVVQGGQQRTVTPPTSQPPKTAQANASVSLSKPTSPPPGTTPAATRGVKPADYEKAMVNVTPVREAASQLFGSGSDPNVKGLLSYAKLADDPESRQKIGGAMQLMFDNMHKASGGSHGDGFIDWAKNSSGATQAMAEARAQVLNGALGQFKPEELEAFDALASSVSTIIGLRSLTRASASSTSARALENDIPVIGVNTVNSREFYNKMAKLATLVQNGAKGILPGVIPKDEYDKFINLPSQIAKKATGGIDPTQQYVAGHVYGGKTFLGGDYKDGKNWK